MIVKILSFLVVAGFVAFFEIKHMKKEKMKKEMIVFSIVLFFSSVLFILELTELNLLNPLAGLKAMFEPIGMAIDQIFTRGGQYK